MLPNIVLKLRIWKSLAEFRLTDFMNNDGSRLYINGKEAWSFQLGRSIVAQEQRMWI
ncbi:hypothetical protein [Acinetobacter baumannii]|uniref:hypothetical protein n=1 Tax=Acinetobacter baumannii TaxID=470 RepID=UPI0035240452